MQTKTLHLNIEKKEINFDFWIVAAVKWIMIVHY